MIIRQLNNTLSLSLPAFRTPTITPCFLTKELKLQRLINDLDTRFLVA